MFEQRVGVLSIQVDKLFVIQHIRRGWWVACFGRRIYFGSLLKAFLLSFRNAGILARELNPDVAISLSYLSFGSVVIAACCGCTDDPFGLSFRTIVS